jgi:hypothetical protein
MEKIMKKRNNARFNEQIIKRYACTASSMASTVEKKQITTQKSKLCDINESRKQK